MLAYYVEWHLREAWRTPNGGPDAPTFEVTTTPEPWHKRALSLVQMIRP
jgi:hypothetical protein